MCKKVLITVGPIPSRIDSVKYITNRFKGGLAMKAANKLHDEFNFDVTVCMWRHAKIETNLPTILIFPQSQIMVGA
jgi:phosphopantothenoylcysteine synthetase/decarboxylase